MGAGVLCAQEAGDAYDTIAVLAGVLRLLAQEPEHRLGQASHPLSAHGQCIFSHDKPPLSLYYSKTLDSIIILPSPSRQIKGV